MKNRRHYDLVVFGAEPSGLAAAACAARSGAYCAVVKTGLEANSVTAAPAVPDFVWRSLDLHETGLKIEPVSARISLFEGRSAIATYADERQTQEAITEINAMDGALWMDLAGELAAKTKGEDVDAAALLERLSEIVPGLHDDAFAVQSLRELLDDFFESDDLKAHLSAVAGSAFAVGGEEPGSSRALAAVNDVGAWRVKNADLLCLTLERLCERLGVERIAAPLTRLERQDARMLKVEFEDQDPIRTRAFMAASLRLAYLAGLKVEGPASPMAHNDTAEATISVKLADQPMPPTNAPGDQNAIYYIAETADEIRIARDAVLEGRMPENPPLVFEFGEKEIIVRAPYCPRLIASEEGPREWTGQDCQVLGKQVLQRLGKYLNGALKDVQRTDVELSGALDAEGAQQLNDDAPAVPAPAVGGNEIGAAATLALRLVGEA